MNRWDIPLGREETAPGIRPLSGLERSMLTDPDAWIKFTAEHPRSSLGCVPRIPVTATQRAASRGFFSRLFRKGV